MSNPFDVIQETIFDTVTAIFGETAVWIPSAGGPPVSAAVLYKDPSAKYGIGESEFDVEEYYMEYKQGDLHGLKEAVNNGHLESITVSNSSGTVEFYVRKCSKKFDGKTIVAILNIK